MRLALRVLVVLVKCRPSRALLGLAVLTVLAAGCQKDVGPQLIDVLDLVPREVEAGDRLEILGAAFPQGKKAKVTFHGQLHRSGEKPGSADIVAEGTASSGSQID